MYMCRCILNNDDDDGADGVDVDVNIGKMV